MFFPVNLWPPALVLPYPGTLGRGFWFLVLIPKDGTKRLLKHELWHVRQDYVTLGLRPFLAIFIKTFKFRCEAAAYGESLRHTPAEMRDQEAERYARFMVDHYGTGKTLEECREAIWRCYETRALF